MLDYPERDEGYASVELRIEEDGLPRVKAAVYDYDGLMPELKPGDIAEFPLEFISALDKYGEPTDIYSSRGILLRAYLNGETENIRRDGRSFLSFPMELANAVRETAKEVFPEDVQSLMLGLLIGDTSGLYDEFELDNALSISGIRHVVAVSGMHLSFLYAVLVYLLGKRRASIVGVPTVVLFTLVTGCTASVVRACVMLVLVMLAPLLRREADGITSLCAGLLILVVMNPLSVAAAGLQLSFTAMAGIILLTPRIYGWMDAKFRRGDKKRRPNAALRFVMAGHFKLRRLNGADNTRRRAHFRICIPRLSAYQYPHALGGVRRVYGRIRFGTAGAGICAAGLCSRMGDGLVCPLGRIHGTGAGFAALCGGIYRKQTHLLVARFRILHFCACVVSAR